MFFLYVSSRFLFWVVATAPPAPPSETTGIPAPTRVDDPGIHARTGQHPGTGPRFLWYHRAPLLINSTFAPHDRGASGPLYSLVTA